MFDCETNNEAKISCKLNSFVSFEAQSAYEIKIECCLYTCVLCRFNLSIQRNYLSYSWKYQFHY